MNSTPFHGPNIDWQQHDYISAWPALDLTPKGANARTPPSSDAAIRRFELDGLITGDIARHLNLPAALMGHVIEKRQRRGRLPKNGIMSKRQRSHIIKQAKLIERAKAEG
jgi:hypothetical protein